ncbi:uncharacterized protein MKK02DRAFT_45206 [Dioszegia hungarica]|uniref:Uncharacterized protein n=1 Tax=Dioszegia hungarica TaxID=4972 RepID=A0AA38H9M6_9TREE|nr:uncharacterized protein MKK02DRAFT_45206 [Dioszegia hungarica]KAI9636502.1 hypothetical protein MKK02DRAFT_45206 [Dioszegia hungarica]
MDTALIDNAESNLPVDGLKVERRTEDIGTAAEKGSGAEASEAAVEIAAPAEEVQADRAGEGELAGGAAEGSEAPAEVPSADVAAAQAAEEGATEVETTKAEDESTSAVPEDKDGQDGGDETHPASEIVRTDTPGSRTSTPPPGAVTAPKKFSAVNVTKKFLSKTAQPSPVPSPGTKLGLNGRPSASPVPISSSSSRLLSTTLTTAPLAKSSASSTPPVPAVSASSSASPWAKPAAALETTSETSTQQTKRSLGNMASSTSQGQGQAQGSAASKTVAWRSVVPEGRSRIGMSRDFPTAREIAEGESRLGREIAEGKMQAQLAAQQQAAHNQALLKSLNAFTHLDSAHRWDDDDDGDDVIDFGDGSDLPPLPTPIDVAPPAAKPERYVAADDFDRSWPRKAPVEIAGRREERVLFNANSNRLEPSLPRQAPPPAPTRLMSRNSDQSVRPPTAAGPSILDRALPPHQQQQPGNRALPPHMAGMQQEAPRAMGSAPPAAAGRPAWSMPRDMGRPAPAPSAVPEREITRPAVRSPVKSTTNLPSRPTWEQQAAQPQQSAPRPPPPTQTPSSQAPPPPTQPSVTSPPAVSASLAGGKVDEQTAEMHTAAERARLRRLAEEAERSAAMERAKRKAKELEERLGIKSAAPAAPAAAPAPVAAPPPPPPTILRRPMPAAPAPPPGLAPSTSAPPPPVLAPAPAGPKPEPSRQVESSWRARPTSSAAEPPKANGPVPPAVAEKSTMPAQPRVDPIRQAHAHAERSLQQAIQAQPARASPPHIQAEAPQPVVPQAAAPSATVPALIEAVVRLPGQAMLPESDQPPRKDSGFDSMLARIQAAMAEARLVAPPIIESVLPPAPAPLPAAPAAAIAQITRSPPKAPSQPPKPTLPPLPYFFDVTHTHPPRSPPPAWRTYTVRLPSSHSPRPTISPARLKSSQTPLSHPQGWLLVFQPPLDLPPNTILADQLLPRPIYQQRFGRPLDSAPIVSISPRKLEPFERKKKKSSMSPVKSLRGMELMPPPSSAESLMAPTQPAYGWQRGDRAAGSSTWTTPAAFAAATVAPPAVSIDTAHLSPDASEGADPSALGLSQIKKPRSPVKSSPAAKAEKEGQFAQEAVSVGPIARSRPVEVKPGVRFMASSELEGDSLLDEVNKMSLETVGEGWGGDEKDDVSKTPGSETPKTPPSLSAGSSRGQPSSPGGAGTPWSRSTPRSATQHDHIKSVWDLAGSADATRPVPSTIADIPLPPPLVSAPSAQSAQSDSSAPMYPSLNTPSSEQIPAMPLPSSSALGYPQSSNSPFSPGSHGAFMRPPTNAHGYAYAPSPTGSAEPYSAAALAARPNGGFSSPWSPAAFGASMPSPGYGYTGKQQSSLPDPKATENSYAYSQAAAFAQAQQQRYAQAYVQQAQAQAQQAQVAAYQRAYGYGYTPQAAVQAQAQAQAQAAGQGGPRAAVGGGRFGQVQPQGQVQVQPGANGDYTHGQAVTGYGEGGYYAAVGAGQQSQRHLAAQSSPVYGQSPLPHSHPHAHGHGHHQQQPGQPQTPQQQQPGQAYGAGAVGQQIMRGQRKMW